MYCLSSLFIFPSNSSTWEIFTTEGPERFHRYSIVIDHYNNHWFALGNNGGAGGGIQYYDGSVMRRLTLDTSLGSSNYVFAPIDANECVISVQFDSGWKDEIILKRNGPTTLIAQGADAGAGAEEQVTLTWDDTHNKITIANNASTGANPAYTQSTFYFYK